MRNTRMSLEYRIIRVRRRAQTVKERIESRRNLTVTGPVAVAQRSQL
jgi:hypothetical protein